MRWPHTICLSSGTRVFVQPDGWLRVGADTSTAVVIPMADRPTAQRVARALLACSSPQPTSAIIGRIERVVSSSFALTLIDELLRTPLLVAGNVRPGQSTTSVTPPHRIIAVEPLSHVLADIFPGQRTLSPNVVETTGGALASDTDLPEPNEPRDSERTTPRASIVAVAVPSPGLLASVDEPYLFVTIRDGALRIGPAMTGSSAHLVGNASGCPLCMHMATASPDLVNEAISGRSAGTLTLTYEMVTVARGIISAQWSVFSDWLALPSLPTPPTVGASISMNPRTLEVVRSPIARDPHCPVCGIIGPRWL
ncbi:hypothetical protein [Corynebacterium sp. SFY-M4]|uniref:hypothetical protein n=1 Tax=Corynebacterium sp. SFY-M4 TaxID=3092265 RepID=UPI00298E5F1B|nr:hypothetical protein [Corynebacterium sp. SFY-M4]